MCIEEGQKSKIDFLRWGLAAGLIARDNVIMVLRNACRWFIYRIWAAICRVKYAQGLFFSKLDADKLHCSQKLDCNVRGWIKFSWITCIRKLKTLQWVIIFSTIQCTKKMCKIKQKININETFYSKKTKPKHNVCNGQNSKLKLSN